MPFIRRYRRRRRRMFGYSRRGIYKPEMNYKDFYMDGAVAGYGPTPVNSLTESPLIVNSSADTAATPAGLTKIDQGTAVSDRVGRSIILKSPRIVTGKLFTGVGP